MSTDAGTAAPTSAGKMRPAIAELFRCREISPAEVAHLFALLAEQDPINEREAEALFALERMPMPKCAEWSTLLIETLSDYLVWQCRPTGVLSEALARWLLSQVDRARTPTGLAILVHVLAEADRVPAWFTNAVRARAAAGWPGCEEALAAALAEERRAA